MRTEQLSLLDREWRRDGEPLPWIASTIAPLAWLGHLLGAPTTLAIVLCVAGLVASVVLLRRLKVRGERSRQHAWFLAQTGVAVSPVSGALVGLGALL